MRGVFILDKFSVNPFSLIHGDIVFKIVKGILNRANIKKIRITDNFSRLLKNLNRICIDNISYSVINCSFGTSNNFDMSKLLSIINLLLDKNIYLVCAASKVESYPACFDNVISVSDLNMYKNDRNEINHHIDFVVDIAQYGFDFIPYSATSFAAPFVTAKAAEIMASMDITSIDELKSELSKHFMKWE